MKPTDGMIFKRNCFLAICTLTSLPVGSQFLSLHFLWEASFCHFTSCGKPVSVTSLPMGSQFLSLHFLWEASFCHLISRGEASFCHFISCGKPVSVTSLLVGSQFLSLHLLWEASFCQEAVTLMVLTCLKAALL